MKENFWGGGMGLSECCALHFFLHDSFRSAVMILLMLLSLFLLCITGKTQTAGHVYLCFSR